MFIKITNNTKSHYKVGQGAAEGNAEACSLQAAQGDRPSNDGIRSHRIWNKAQIISLCTFIGLLSGCYAKTKKAHSPEEEKVVTKNSLENSQIAEGVYISVKRLVEPEFASNNLQISNIEELKGNLNIFDIEIRIPKDKIQKSNSEDYTIEAKSNFANQEPRSLTLQDYGTFVSTQERIDLSSESSNINFSLEIKFLDSEGKIITNKIVLHKDLIIDSDSNLAKANIKNSLEPNIFGRIIMTPKSVLKTEGANITIQAEEFFADNAMITSFTEDSIPIAPPGTKGLDGGKIVIIAKNAKGILNTILRGGTGGVGLKGPLQNELPPKARSGNPGSNGWITRSTFENNIPFCGSIHPIIANELKYWATTNVDKSLHSTRIGIPDSPPTRGENGAQGLKGHRGLPGGNGGNSGSIQIQTLSTADFIVLMDAIPGNPGAGGEGGDGGLGGEGGDGGAASPVEQIRRWPDNTDWFNDNMALRTFCGQGPNGDRGGNGPKGDTGKTGEPGKILKSCATYGENNTICNI